jgi:sec-independent protein translocase protein TatA
MFRNPTADALVVLLVVLLIFGPKRLPTLGRSLGQGLREFKDSITGESKDSEEGERPEITSGAAAPAPTSGVSTPPAGATESPTRESAEVGSDHSS